MRSTFKDSLQGQIWELKKSLRDEESLKKFIFFHGIHLYPVSHPIKPRDFVMFSNMTCDCPLVWLGLAIESATLGHFSEKPRGSTGWESGYICKPKFMLGCKQSFCAMGINMRAAWPWSITLQCRRASSLASYNTEKDLLCNSAAVAPLCVSCIPFIKLTRILKFLCSFKCTKSESDLLASDLLHH